MAMTGESDSQSMGTKIRNQILINDHLQIAQIRIRKSTPFCPKIQTFCCVDGDWEHGTRDRQKRKLSSCARSSKPAQTEPDLQKGVMLGAEMNALGTGDIVGPHAPAILGSRTPAFRPERHSFGRFDRWALTSRCKGREHSPCSRSGGRGWRDAVCGSFHSRNRGPKMRPHEGMRRAS